MWDASQVNKAKIEYFDYANDTTMQDLDDSTTHSHWRLRQTKHHLETKPHHGFKDMDQMCIGYHALYKANVEVGMEPHNAPIGSTARSKSQVVLIPARGSKLDDYDRNPLIVPEYNGKCIRPPGQVDNVVSAGCLGDTIGSDIDTEVMQTDARVSAANKRWYSLKSRGMPCSADRLRAKKGAATTPSEKAGAGTPFRREDAGQLVRVLFVK